MSNPPTMTLHKAVSRVLAASAARRQDREADLAINWYADLIDKLPRTADGVPDVRRDEHGLVFEEPKE